MTIQFNCIQCNNTIETPDDAAGKKCRCPDCGQIMPVPDPGSPIGQPFVDPANYPNKPGAESTNPYAAPTPSSTPFQTPIGMGAPEPADRSVLVLVFGITSIVVSFISCGCCALFFPLGLGLGIPAWIMGRNDLRAIAQGQRHPSQKGNLQAGMICGIVGVGIAIVAVLVTIASIVLQFGVMGFEEFAR